ncbi:MAG: Flp pilus assembly complex ATPase component TadA [Planctomycetes bacterium]|nr:Flp pilus assembly complex ATPase component TadA [Planctomycetota bacterium]
MARRKQLGQILKEMELVKESQIQEALAVQQKKGGAIGRILIRLGYVTEEELSLALGAQVGMEVINLDEMEIPQEIIDKIPASMTRSAKIIPVRLENNTLTVAMANPLNMSALDDIRFMMNCEVKGAVSSEESVKRALDKYYREETGPGSILEELTKNAGEENIEILDTKGSSVDIANVEAMADQAPIKKLLNYILLHAIKAQASDIHFEPFAKEFKVRYRVDGILYEMVPPPLHLAMAIISRIKVMANMDISETRKPQDNRIPLMVGGKKIDIRVSTLPTVSGESVVMRVLDKSVVALDLDNIGLRDEDAKLIKKLMVLPNGIIVVTGPTGSGKTTTLYSALNYINTVKQKIITTEDPVEYDLPGIIQCEIKDDIGVTYAICLRNILRQDPDKILVGEMRDAETARMGIEASLTGHLVLTTLHTNDAPQSIARLLDLGIEPYLVTATVEAIIAQRLIRRICPKCKEEIDPTDEMLMELQLKEEDIQGKKFFYGKKCTDCNNVGYKGRMALFEIMLLTNKIKTLIMEQASTEKLRLRTRQDGMRTLRESGLLAIFDGQSTVEEVVKETLAIQ